MFEAQYQHSIETDLTCPRDVSFMVVRSTDLTVHPSSAFSPTSLLTSQFYFRLQLAVSLVLRWLLSSSRSSDMVKHTTTSPG